jgi:hypothetical protein
MKRLLSAIASVAMLASFGSLAEAKAPPCRDAKGKFIKCADKKPAPRCRNAKGQFAKCGTTGAVPVK